MMFWIARGVAVLAAILFAVGGLTILPLSTRAGVYLMDRNLGIALLLMAFLALRWTRPLGALLLGTVAMHLFDGVADVAFRNTPAAAGSIVVAAISLVAGVWLLRERQGIVHH